MAKHKKRRNIKAEKREKLNKLNKILYAIIGSLVFSLWLFLCFVFSAVKSTIVNSKPNILANKETGAIFLSGFSWIIVGIYLSCILSNLYYDRIPIIKNRKTNLNKHKEMGFRKVLKRVGVLSLIFVIISLPCIMAIFSRYELTETKIIRYNSLNIPTQTIDLNKAKSVEVGIDKIGYKSSYYTIAYEIKFKNKSYRFRNFKNTESLKNLDKRMSHLPKDIKQKERLPKLKSDINYSDEKWKMILDIFNE